MNTYQLASEPLVPAHQHGISTPVIRFDREPGDCELCIDGAFDAQTVGDINPAIEAVVADHPHHVTLDLGGVSLMDSSGVGALLGLWKRMKAYDGSLVIAHAHDQPLMMLKLLKLDRAFGI